VENDNLACVYSRLASVARSAGKTAEAEANRAKFRIRKAIDGGHHDLSLFRSDPDLDAIRQRPDFPLLLMDLAFPIDALAR
jgi:hypothetical protein